MNQIIFITGGARSGKSRYAQSLLERLDKVIYAATAVPIDSEMDERIARHKESRNPLWHTIEINDVDGFTLPSSLLNYDGFLLDCLTIMITNIMFKDKSLDWDSIAIETLNRIEEDVETRINGFLDVLAGFKGKVIIVSNEVGMGLVPEYPLGRYFRDIAGRINQKIASLANEVYFVVSGIPLKIK